MQGMKALTKRDLREFVEEKFKGYEENDVVATFFYCSDDCSDKGLKASQQQAILFRKEVENR